MELKVEAKVENVDALTTAVNECLERMGCSMRSMTQIDIALDELFSNVCNYAYEGEPGHVNVRISEVQDGNAVRITLEDSGIPFDPLKQEDPDVSKSIHERTIGGLGIFMVKRTMDDVLYEYRDGLNMLTVIKSL